MSQPTGKDTPQTTPATSDPSQQNIPQATTSSASIPPQSRGPTSPDQSTTTATTTTGNHDYTQTETVNQGIAHQSDGDQDDHVEVVSQESFLIVVMIMIMIMILIIDPISCEPSTTSLHFTNTKNATTLGYP